MDELLRIFLSWQFMIFCLGLAAMGFILRKIIEYTILDNPHVPGSKHSMVWRSLILPIAPVVSGAVAGYFAKSYPYPEGLGTSEYGRISFGLVAGLLSGLVYRVISELLKSKMAQGYVAGATGTPFDGSIVSQDTTQNIQVTLPSAPNTTVNVVNPNTVPVVPNIADTTVVSTQDGSASVTPEGIVTTVTNTDKPTDS